TRLDAGDRGLVNWQRGNGGGRRRRLLLGCRGGFHAPSIAVRPAFCYSPFGRCNSPELGEFRIRLLRKRSSTSDRIATRWAEPLADGELGTTASTGGGSGGGASVAATAAGASGIVRVPNATWNSLSLTGLAVPK